MPKYISILFLTSILFIVRASSTGSSFLRNENENPGENEARNLGMMMMSSKSRKTRNNMGKQRKIHLKVTNLSFQQPFSGVFVMTHNAMAPPLFTPGETSSEALALLAENGNPGPLVDMYSPMETVGDAFAFTDGAPYMGGESFVVEIDYDPKFPYVSLATMAIHTNDAFVAINGRKLMPGDVFTGPAYDAGSEENNELCSSIPGPACASIDTGNIRSGNGEGFVHVHRGFFGIGDLSAAGYDWNNPMVLYEVM